jgi:hypothetical protein
MAGLVGFSTFAISTAITRRTKKQVKLVNLDISYKPLSALGLLYIAVILYMAYRIWWLFPYMKYPESITSCNFQIMTIKKLATMKSMPYQTLIRHWLAEEIKKN